MTKVKIFRFKVVLFGATSSPFLLNQTIKHHLESQTDSLSPSLMDCFYIDNFQRCQERVEDIVKERPLVESVMLKGNMPLAKWNTNAPLNSTYLPKGDHDYLGLVWNTERDDFSVKMSVDIKTAIGSVEQYSTKRKVVSLFSTLYDPIGLLAPISLHGKLFIQSLWMIDKKWDTPLTEEQQLNLSKAVKKYKGLEQIKVPRNIFRPGQNQLHVFTDASKRAYGVAAYVVTPDGSSNLLTSRSRFAPKKMLEEDTHLTTPKLELTALLLGCRLIRHLQEVQPHLYTELFVWTDATVSLQWVTNRNGH